MDFLYNISAQIQINDIQESLKNKTLECDIKNQFEMKNFTHCRNIIFKLFIDFFKLNLPIENFEKVVCGIAELHPELCDNIVEILWLIGIHFSMDKEKKSDNLIKYEDLVKRLVEKDLLRSLIFERLEEETLAACQLIDLKTFSNKRVRIKTKTAYEQQKYNLLREESEGFSKLYTELIASEMNEQNIETIKQRIKIIIGFFDLDINRVIDLIIDAFANNITNLNFIQILKLFSHNSITQVLGFRFQKTYEDCLQNRNLYVILAHLIKQDIVTLEGIWPHLLQQELDFASIEEEKNKYAINYMDHEIRKRLNYTPEEEEKKKVEHLNDKSNACKTFPNCQKIILIECLIEVNCWIDAQILIEMNPFDCSISPNLLRILRDLLSWTIEPLYRPYAYTKFIKNCIPQFPRFEATNSPKEFAQSANPISFLKNLSIILNYLSIYIIDPILFTKLCIIIKNILKSDKTIENSIIELLLNYLLPAFSLIKVNPSCTNELWEVLELIEIKSRFSIYSSWLSEKYFFKPILVVTYSNNVSEINKLLNRITKNDAQKKGKSISKIANSNPVVIMEQIVKYLMQYFKQIQIVITSLNHCSQLALDVASFMQLKYISCSKKLIIGEDGNIEPWFTNLGYALAYFFKKNEQLDMKPLLHWIGLILKNNKFEEASILNHIIAKMVGWVSLNLDEMTDDALDSFAGGLFLRAETTHQSNDIRKAKIADSHFSRLFWDQNASKNNVSTFPLSLILNINFATIHQHILTNFPFNNTKMLSIQYDQLHSTFLSLNDFFQFNKKTWEGYKEYYPNELGRILSESFRLTPEMVFYLIRPALMPIYEMTPEIFQQTCNMFGQIFDYYISNKLNDESMLKSEYFNSKDFINNKYKNIWNSISKELYTFFWILNLNSIYYPTETYKKKLLDLEEELNKLNKSGPHKEGGSTMKKMKRIEKTINNLKDESNSIQIMQKKTLEYLEANKNILLPPTYNKEEITNAFIQICIYPRMVFSAADAIYSIKIILLLVELKMDFINVITMIDRLLKNALPCAQCCTENEAICIAIFFAELIKQLKNWSDETNWEKGIKNMPSFVYPIGSNKKIDIKTFCQAISKVYKVIWRVVNKLLTSKEYMQIRNGLQIVKKIIQYFPKEFIGKLKETLEALISIETREDLKMNAQRFKDKLESISTEEKLPKPSKEQNDKKKPHKKHSDDEDSKSRHHKKKKTEDSGKDRGRSKSPRDKDKKHN